LTIDPARRLANSLGLAEMTTSEQEVPKALFDAQGLPMKGSLFAMMLDTKRTFDALVAEQASSPEARDRILNNEIYRYVSTSLAGTQEYMAMEKLYQVRKDPEWDLIVLDTPPTQNALDFLDEPERMIGAIDSPATRWFAQAFQNASGSGAFSFLGRGAGLVFKGLSRFTGAEFLERVAEFIAGLNELFGSFKERAHAVEHALRSPDVAFVVVTSPSPMAIREARYFSDRLKEAGMRRDAVVINQVHPVYPGQAPTRDALAGSLEPHVPSEIDRAALSGHLEQALAEEQLRGLSDRREADSLKKHIGEGVVFVEVPAFEADVHDLRALARVASYLTGKDLLGATA
jgi:anion-transporting  ArsA/GET3 family ATPase